MTQASLGGETEDSLELLLAYRLGAEIIESDSSAVLMGLFKGVGSEGDDEVSAAEAAEFLGGLVAIHLRHVQIPSG
ncbi:MAG: hypothetical protein RL095_1220 [Verrucomicrobiota bacterium]